MYIHIIIYYIYVILLWNLLVGCPSSFPRSLIKMIPIEKKLRNMVDHAMAWATSNGLQRKNVVHGAEEYRVPTDFKFLNRGIDRASTKASSSVELEAGLLLQSCFSPHRSM